MGEGGIRLDEYLFFVILWGHLFLFFLLCQVFVKPFESLLKNTPVSAMLAPIIPRFSRGFRGLFANHRSKRSFEHLPIWRLLRQSRLPKKSEKNKSLSISSKKTRTKSATRMKIFGRASRQNFRICLSGILGSEVMSISSFSTFGRLF